MELLFYLRKKIPLEKRTDVRYNGIGAERQIYVNERKGKNVSLH